jgi:hypothetical protein
LHVPASLRGVLLAKVPGGALGARLNPVGGAGGLSGFNRASLGAGILLEPRAETLNPLSAPLAATRITLLRRPVRVAKYISITRLRRKR